MDELVGTLLDGLFGHDLLPAEQGTEASASEDSPAPLVACSLSGRIWRWRQGSDRVAFAIAERLGIPEIVGRILASRGIGIEDAADFLNPTLRSLLPDPLVLTDMASAASRLADAVRARETLAVFGDYDVDGACSAAIVTGFLRELGCTVLPYIPDRLTEGYGPNAPALARLADQGATLVVCVDCGTAAAGALAILQGRADAVVLDHHKAEGLPPPITATVNPNRIDDRSGLHNLCAAAVAFMAAIATVRILRRTGFFATRPEPDLFAMLDMVALATVCDVMPLTGLNRAFVAQGLRVMARRARPGIAALIDVAQTRDLPTAMTCGFGLGPRINAGGRISEADLGLRLLLSEDPLDARMLAERLDAVNRQRQDVEAGIMDTAIAAAEAQVQAGHNVLLVTGETWHPGVVGIVAGRLKERFNRPALVGGMADGMIKGSGRSVPGLDLGSAVIAALQAGLLATGGGHAMAAGFSMAPSQQDGLHRFLCERLPLDPRAPKRPDLTIEATLATDGATIELATHLASLAPFGNGHEEPVIMLASVRVTRSERIGQDGNTIRAFIESDGAATKLKAMLFRAGDTPVARAIEDRTGGRLHIAGTLRAETWQGRTTACFTILDAAPCG